MRIVSTQAPAEIWVKCAIFMDFTRISAPLVREQKTNLQKPSYKIWVRCTIFFLTKKRVLSRICTTSAREDHIIGWYVRLGHWERRLKQHRGNASTDEVPARPSCCIRVTLQKIPIMILRCSLILGRLCRHTTGNKMHMELPLRRGRSVSNRGLLAVFSRARIRCAPSQVLGWLESVFSVEDLTRMLLQQGLATI